jgi:hypothetical protein
MSVRNPSRASLASSVTAFLAGAGLAGFFLAGFSAAGGGGNTPGGISGRVDGIGRQI